MSEPVKVRAIYKFKGTNNDEVSSIYEEEAKHFYFNFAP